jgi:hypothetical protein
VKLSDPGLAGRELKFCFNWLVWKRRQRQLRQAGAGTRTTRLHLQDSLHSIWAKGRTSIADCRTYTGEFVADPGSCDRRKCPCCHSTELHRSHARGYEALLPYFGVRAYRCNECDRSATGDSMAAQRTLPLEAENQGKRPLSSRLRACGKIFCRALSQPILANGLASHTEKDMIKIP